MANSSSFVYTGTLSGGWIEPPAGTEFQVGVAYTIGDANASGYREVTVTLTSRPVEVSGETWGTTSDIWPSAYILLNDTTLEGPYTGWSGHTFTLSEQLTKRSGKIRCRLSTGTGSNHYFDICDLANAINNPPTVNITVPEPLYGGATVPIKVTISDEESDYCTGRLQAIYSKGSQTYNDIFSDIFYRGTTSYDVTINAGYANGTVKFAVGASDSVGNTTTYMTAQYNILQNTLPTAVIAATGVFPGGTANITWQYSEVDSGQTVIAKSLVRYYQAKNSTSWQTTQITITSTATTAQDTIPTSYNGGTIYYQLTFSDQVGANQTAKTPYYTLKTVIAPPAPQTITYPASVNSATNFTVSWTKVPASANDEYTVTGYVVERKYNNTSWSEVYRAPDQPNTVSFTTNVPVTTGATSVSFRVKALDSESGLESPYTTGGTTTVVYNTAPSQPPSITVPSSISTGQSFVVKWGAATDSDGDTITYVLERSVNGGTYTQVAQTQSLNYTDTAASSWNTVQYRVKAVDSHGTSSQYKVSVQRTVVKNNPPTITCEYHDGQDLGIKNQEFTFNYSVNDVDASDTLTVKLYVDETQIKSFVATRSTIYTFDFGTNGQYWNTITNGQHTVTVSVTDGTATTRIRLSFLKAETGCAITLTNPIQTLRKVYYVILSISYYLPISVPWQTDDQYRIAKLFEDNFQTVDVYCTETEIDEPTPVWESCLINVDQTGGMRKDNIWVKGNNVAIFMRQGNAIFIHKFENPPVLDEGFTRKVNFRIVADSGSPTSVGHICSVQGALGLKDIDIPSFPDWFDDDYSAST